MRRELTNLILIAGAAAWCTGAEAGTPINETRTVAPDAEVVIENLIGPVTVKAWDKNQVEVTGTLGDGPERLEFDVDEDEVRIEVIWPEDHEGRRRTRNPEETVLNVIVPRKSSVSVEGVNTAITVSGVEGEVELASVNGDITVTGDPEEIEATTVNGIIDIDSGAGEIDAETVNGELRIRGVRGEFSGATVNGDIRITGGLEGECDFSSVSGDIRFSGGLQGRGPFEFETHSGSILLELPRNVSARFEIETFSGDIDNDFGERPRRTSQYGPGMELNFETGGGGSRVEASSFSGRVEIRRY